MVMVDRTRVLVNEKGRRIEMGQWKEVNKE